MSDESLEMTELNPAEQSRAYLFPDGTVLVFENVTHFMARPSGTHRLKTGDGKLHIVAAGWLKITIEAENWTL